MRSISLSQILLFVFTVACFTRLNVIAWPIESQKLIVFKYRFGFPFVFALGDSERIGQAYGIYIWPLIGNVVMLVIVAVIGFALIGVIVSWANGTISTGAIEPRQTKFR